MLTTQEKQEARREHLYATTIAWTGNLGDGTRTYTAYSRDHEIRVEGKPPIPGSSDPAFRGDPARYNPEDMLVAALSACHMLWYLGLCAKAGVVVADYRDAATGRMLEEASGGGRFIEVTLRPRVTIAAGSDPRKARQLHDVAHARCYIANSVNFPVACLPEIASAAAD
jgi:organic hydroperoxide reductase OsmC/OhrA